jgi:hypothetical protein
MIIEKYHQFVEAVKALVQKLIDLVTKGKK